MSSVAQLEAQKMVPRAKWLKSGKEKENSQYLSWLLIELQSSSKNQKNPHDQLSGVGDTFQSSKYHRFPLKCGRVKKIPHP